MGLLIMAIRFVLEILALIIVGIWGYRNGNLIGAIGLPLIVAVIWAIFGSPGAPYKLHGIYKILLELSIFLVASYFLYKLGHSVMAMTFAGVAIITSFLIVFLNI